MKRGSMVIGLGILAFSLIGWRSPLYPQEKPSGKKAKPPEIEGLWIEVSRESEGKMVSSLPEPHNRIGSTVVFLWKISKDKIETGPDNHLFPMIRMIYEFIPGNKAGMIDLIPLDKNGKKMVKDKSQAIYVLKDDWLFICWSTEMRPETFATFGNGPKRELCVLRRSKVK
jgi:hypothetical protein